MREMRTERLLLRPFTVDDAPDCYREIYSDLAVVEHYSHLRFAGVAEVRDHIAGHVRAWAGQLGRHAVVRLTDGAFAGQVHLNPYVNADRWSGEPARPVNTVEVELAFAFGRRFWGNGYAQEACRAVIGYCFDELRLPRLVGGAKRVNSRSIALQRRLGFAVHDIDGQPDGEYVVTVLDHPLTSGQVLA
jgi:[ribosomal protein S5]-alanine N-acetyltransferase